jgi:hypothetical protein
MKLVWGNGEGQINNNTSSWTINDAPQFSFQYDGLFYSDETNFFVKKIGIGATALSAAEISEIKNYISSQQAPQTGLTLQQKQDYVWVLIKTERMRRTETGGYKVVVDNVDKWFHSDVFSRSQQIGLTLMGTSIPANLQWRTMDGSFVIMTPTLASQIFSAAAASDQAIFAQAEAHQQAMLQAADPLTYDYLSGWPKIYGEI